ncbi:MAG: GtrA family protein [Cyanobacteria bacterium P01_F01_bin.86]
MRKPLKKSVQKTLAQLYRYTFVGGAAAVVDISSFAIFSEIFHIDYRIAVVFSFTLGALVNFSLCNWLVFQGKLSPLWLVFVRHYLSGIYGLLINELAMITLVELLQFEQLILAKIISTGVAFVFNFLIKKFYVYNNSYYPAFSKKTTGKRRT